MTVITKDKAEQLEHWNFPDFDSSTPKETIKKNPKDDALQVALQQAYDAGKADATAKAEQQSLEVAQQKAEQLFNQQWQNQCQTLNLLMKQITAPITLIDQQVEAHVKTIIMKLVKRMVLHEIQLQPEALVDMIQQALALLPLSIPQYQIKLHPEDLSLIEQQLEPELRSKLLVDPKLQRGDIQIAAGATVINGKLDERLMALVDGAYESQ